MEKVSSSIMHLNLQTKSKRKVLKSALIREEIARLERANGYIKHEPEQKCYIVRNKKRIKVLQLELSKTEAKEMLHNG